MPNHVTHLCTVTGSPADIARFRAAHFTTEEEKESFDFQTVIPRPPIAGEVTEGTVAEAGFFALTGMVHMPYAFSGMNGSPMQWYGKHRGFVCAFNTSHDDFAEWLEKNEPNALTEGAKMLQCFRETGFKSWYDWNTHHWGTKWGAYDFEWREQAEQRLVFKFETAWSPPRPIFDRLAEMYPELAFDLLSHDEGGPEYVGRYAGTERRWDKVDEDRARRLAIYGEGAWQVGDESDDEAEAN